MRTGYEERASILQGAGDMIFKLVRDRSSPEQWAEWLRAPLEHAAGTANYELVDKLLKAGANGSAGWRGCHGKTLLHAGAEGGNAQVVSALITAGGAGEDMKARAPATGSTPLHLAVIGGRESAARALIMAGADVNARNGNHDTPLRLAIEGGHVRLAENLLFSGADPDEPLPDEQLKGFYPIHRAAYHGLDDVVRALMLKGVNPNCLNYLRETPLMTAAQAGHVSSVKVLLAGGADARFQQDYFCWTALHFAAESSKTESIPALIKAGGDIEARTSLNDTPLTLAAIQGSCAAMLALLQLGANPHTKCDAGYTPLHFVCQQGLADAADLLMRWGADETAISKCGKTPSLSVPPIAEAPQEDRPRLERLSKLLANAPHDRAWRRRGFVVMCRAHPDRLRLVMEIPDAAAGAIVQPQQRPRHGARSGQVKVDVEMGSTHGGGEGRGAGSSARAERIAGRDGTGGGGFDGVAAWLVALGDHELFRNIVGFL